MKEDLNCHAAQISFWEGVLAIIDEAAQVKTFSQVERFAELQEFANRNLNCQEHFHKKALVERQQHRQSFLKYATQIGRLKGYAHAIKFSEASKRHEEKFSNDLQNRMRLLLKRLEKLDFELTSMTNEKIQKKRTTKSYYQGLGKLSTYRTIVKSLPCERTIDFLIMALAKMRVQDVICLVAHQDRYTHQVKTIKQPQILTALQKMIVVEQLDKTFNLGRYTAESKQDARKDHSRFQDELNQLSEMQRLMGEAPDHPVIEALSKQPPQK